MRRLEVVIAAGDGEICRTLTEAVSRMPEMSVAFCTGSESCAIEYMQMHRTDILFLEMDLAEGNGMSLLEQIECTVQPRPLMIVMMESGQTAVLEYLHSHGIDYICQKGKNDDSPQRLTDIAYRLYPYSCFSMISDSGYTYHKLTGGQADVVTRDYIERELLRMGFRQKYVVFSYIAEGIELLIHWDENEQVQITRDLYPLIAQRYHATKAGVERAIRISLQAAFTSMSDEEISRHYPYPFDRARKRPSNADFLANMSKRLTLD